MYWMYYFCHMSDFPKKLQKKLSERAENNSLRCLPQVEDHIDFSSNDYLGFGKNEDIYANTFQYLLGKGISQNGATGSRLISGNHHLYSELENYLTNFHQVESALVFNSGYDANIGFFSTVPQRNDFVFYDELIHASIRDGIRMGNAKSHKFNHNDLDDLKRCIERSRNAIQDEQNVEIYIVTESVFSMDGDSPDLKVFAEFCSLNGFYFVVDEAHAVGVFGRKGAGLIQELALQEQIFARIITFGKALGCHGAAILGSTKLKSYLLNFSRSFIYTTGLSPHTIASIFSAYTFLGISKGIAEQEALKENILAFKGKLKTLGLTKNFINSESAIQSCVISGNDKVKSISKKLLDDGFNVKAILAPTVSEGEERLRFCLHSFNAKEEIGFVLQLLKNQL